MKVPFLGPNGGEPVARNNAGGTVTKGEPRGRAERNTSAAAHGGGPMTNVALTVTPPSQITIQPSSKLGPVASIPAGGNYVFQIDYTIDSQATDGQISLPIHFSQDTQFATFRTTDTSVT